MTTSRSDIKNSANWGFETKQVHIGQENPDLATGARAVPIYASTSFVFEDCRHAADRFALRDEGNIYGRLTNPTGEVFERRMAALEGGAAALAVSSGAAAVSYAIQALAKAGEHIVASRNIYGGTYHLLAHTLPLTAGITATFVDPEEEGAFEGAIQENTKAVFTETLGNPHSNVADLETLSKIAHSHQIPLVVDSTFATPYLVRPIEHGADIVVHSATKFIGGHGTALGGVLVDGGRFDWKASGKYPWISEANPSYHGISFTEAAPEAPFAAYVRAVLLRDTGATLYKKYFPKGGGSIFTFEIKGGEREARAFIDNLPIFSLLANVADVKSLVIHPATTTHSQCTEEELAEQGIRPNTIRLSIGIEKAEDLIAALEEGFRQ